MTRPVKRGTFRRWCRVCGWKGTYATAAKGDYAKKRHSCKRWIARAEAATRGEQLRARVDRTPKPCLHKQANHQHGTYACYTLDGCRCLPCAQAVREYEQNRVRQQAYGRWNGLVDAEPSRRHVRALMDAGMGLKRIVAVSGIPQGQLWKLMYGKKRPDGSQVPSKRVRPSTEARILAVRLDLADGARVDSIGAVRRLQALVALGWSQSKVANRLGILPANFTPVIQGRRSTITVAHDKAVRALYDDLSMRLPPEVEWRDKIAAARARNYAKARGWLPPLAWDDDQLDDPECRPAPLRERGLVHDEVLDEAAIYRRSHGDREVRLSKAEAAELVHRWANSGRSLADCERVTGIKVDRFYRLKDQQEGGAA